MRCPHPAFHVYLLGLLYALLSASLVSCLLHVPHAALCATDTTSGDRIIGFIVSTCDKSIVRPAAA